MTDMPDGQHVLYRHYAKDGTLLYAGRTNNPPARLDKHQNGVTAFPLTTETLSLMCAWRDDWPETVPEWLR